METEATAQSPLKTEILTLALRNNAKVDIKVFSSYRPFLEFNFPKSIFQMIVEPQNTNFQYLQI